MCNECKEFKEKVLIFKYEIYDEDYIRVVNVYCSLGVVYSNFEFYRYIVVERF